MITLFCFPFAGGDAASYNCFNAFAHAQVRISPIELPGRGLRYSEEMSGDIQHMAADCLSQVIAHLGGPFAFFGHSMGALLSYLAAKKMKEQKMPLPAHLFVSGCAGPRVLMTAARKRMPEKDELRKKMKEVMDIPASLIDSEIFSMIYEPLIYADLAAFKQYRYEEQAPLDIPITVFTGLEDDVTIAEARAWQRETTMNIEHLPFAGKHHFWKNYPEEIMNIIKQRTTAVIPR